MHHMHTPGQLSRFVHMEIENKEQTILGLHANFELDRTMHERTGAKNVRARTGLHRRSDLRQKL